MKTISRMIATPIAFSALLLANHSLSQTPPTTYGTLDNFDVVNDTGVETHGFEIELEGCSVADVPYFFGAPYQRYGDPEIVSNGTGGVIVRYKALYDSGAGAWSAGTPVVSSFPPTDGHSCWTYGDPNYPNVGCDHFGVSLNVTPTKTTYRWLVENPAVPGTLKQFDTNIPLPAPVWNVTPPVDPAVDQPIAAVVLSPLPSNDPDKCGEAMWVKVYTTELPNGLHEDDLNHMIVDDPDVDIVPDENDPLEVEFEWYLLQGCPGELADEFGGANEVGEGNEAVSRRFEFYKYTGQYDPDPEAINEAMCDNPLEITQQIPERCGEPNADGVAGVGDYIGKQNVAINLGGEFAVPNQPPVATNNSATTSEDTAISLSVTSDDTDADGSVNSASVDLDQLTAGQQTTFASAAGNWSVDIAGNVTFTPVQDFNGTTSIGYTVEDNDSHISNLATVTVDVTPVNDPPVANDQSVTTAEDTPVNISLTASDVDSSSLSYSVVTGPVNGTVTGLAPDLTYTPNGNYNGADSFTFKANDGSVDSNIATVHISVTAVNDPPVANAGADQPSVNFHDTVTLDGSGSADIDGDSLTYSWKLVIKPAHSKAKLSTTSAVNPTFFADKEGTYQANLVVNDRTLDSAADSVTITVKKVKKNAPGLLSRSGQELRKLISKVRR